MYYLINILLRGKSLKKILYLTTEITYSSLPSYDLCYDISQKHRVYIKNILPITKNFLWLTKWTVFIKDMTD